MALSVDIGANTRAAQREVKDLSKALDLTADSLDDLARDGDKAGDKLEDSFREASRDVKQFGDDAEKSFRDLVRDAGKAERAVKDVGDNDGMHKLRDGAQEVTQEVGQNLGEAVSSIRGDLTDLGQVGQDTLGGLAATLASTGPAGIAGAAALAAGAVGLGLITAEIEEQNKKAEALKTLFADAWKAAIQGGNDYIDTAVIAGQISEIAMGDDWAAARADALKVQQATGLDLERIYQALAGDMGAAAEVSGVLNEAEKVRNQTIKDALDGSTKLTSEQSNQIREQHEAITNLQGDLDTVKSAYDTASDSAKVAAAATSDYWLRVIDDADSATTAVDDFGNTIVTLPDGKEIVIDAETGQATEDVSKFKTDTDGVIKQLDGSEINLLVKTALTTAQNDINRFLKTNDGKSFKLHGRVEVDSGWD